MRLYAGAGAIISWDPDRSPQVMTVTASSPELLREDWLRQWSTKSHFAPGCLIMQPPPIFPYSNLKLMSVPQDGLECLLCLSPGHAGAMWISLLCPSPLLISCHIGVNAGPDLMDPPELDFRPRTLAICPCSKIQSRGPIRKRTLTCSVLNSQSLPQCLEQSRDSDICWNIVHPKAFCLWRFLHFRSWRHSRDSYIRHWVSYYMNP
jgi:hypothetical protein